VLTQLGTPAYVGSVEALLQYRPKPGVTTLSPTWEPLLLKHTPQPPNLRPWQVTEVTEVDFEGLCSWTSRDLWVVSLLLSLSELLNYSSPLAWCRLRLSVSSTSPRSGPGQ
jgi:hypothetical protein